MKTLTIIFIAIFALCLPIAAQSTPDFQMVKTEDGMIVVNNNKSQRFSFLVAGANPKGEQSDDGSVMVITDSPDLAEAMLIFCVKKSDFPQNSKIADEVEMLTTYRRLNVAKLEQIYQAKVNVDVDMKSFVTVSNLTNKLFPTKLIPTFYWSYIAPTPQNTIRSLFQSVVIGDQVLVIATAFPESIKLEQVKKIFKQTFESIALLSDKQPTVTPKKKITKNKTKKS
jgi:hypothetical protein